MKKLRVGIIGLGMISHRHMTIYRHINELSEKLGFSAEIAAVAEVIPERLKVWAEQYGMDEKDCYVDYHELLKRDDIDYIDVCVHTNYHTPVTIECLKAGFDCYCEKPGASTYADCKLMIDAAKKLGRKLHFQMSSVMTPQAEMAREYVEAGKIGAPYLANLEYCLMRRRPGYDVPEFPQGFLSSKICGHGESIDLGIYVVGHMLYALGNPKISHISGFSGQFVKHDPSRVTIEGGFDVDDTVDGMIRFENGVSFHYLLTSANNMKNYITSYIWGTDGSVEFLGIDMNGYKLARKNITDDAGFMGEPDIIYHADQGDSVTEEKLDCDARFAKYLEEDPKKIYRYDNQCHWMAYKLGLISEEERVNTSELTLNMLAVTDGIFLSDEMGRSVTMEEIMEKSPSLYAREQEIDGKMYTFDVEV